MYNSIFIVGLLTFLCLPSQSFGLGWKEIATQTAEKNQILLAQKELVFASQAQVSVAKSPLFPSVTLSGAWNEFVGARKELEHQAFIGPRWRYILYQGGKIGYGIEAASFQQKQAELSQTLASIEINSKLRQAFSNVIYAKSSLELTQKIEKQRFENVKFSEVRYRGGLDFKWVYLSSKAKWELAKVGTEEAILEQKSTLKDLEVLTGPLLIKSIDEINADGFYADDAPIEPEKVLSHLDQHPKIEFQKKASDESRARINISNAEQWPTLTFQADTLLSSTQREDMFPYLSAGVFLTLPVFEGFRYQKNEDTARARYLAEINELTQVKLDLVARIQRGYQDYLLAKKRLEVSRMNLEANEGREKVVSKQYRAGIASFLDWERSQDDWVFAQTDLLRSIRTYQTARARYEELIGTELAP